MRRRAAEVLRRLAFSGVVLVRVAVSPTSVGSPTVEPRGGGVPVVYRGQEGAITDVLVCSGGG